MFDMFPRTLSSATGFYFNSIERLSLLPFVAAHQSRHFWIRSEKHMFHNEMVHTHSGIMAIVFLSQRLNAYLKYNPMPHIYSLIRCNVHTHAHTHKI